MAVPFTESPGFNVGFPSVEEEYTEPEFEPDVGPTQHNADQAELDKLELERLQIEERMLKRKLQSKPLTHAQQIAANTKRHLDFKAEDRIGWSQITKSYAHDFGSAADEWVNSASMALGAGQSQQPAFAPQEPRVNAPSTTPTITPYTEQQGPVDPFAMSPERQQAVEEMIGSTYSYDEAAGRRYTEEKEFESTLVPWYDDPIINAAIIASQVGTATGALRAAGAGGRALAAGITGEVADALTGYKILTNPIKALIQAKTATNLERGIRATEAISKTPIELMRSASQVPVDVKSVMEAGRFTQAMSEVGGAIKSAESQRAPLLTPKEISQEQRLTNVESTLQGLNVQELKNAEIQRTKQLYSQTPGGRKEEARNLAFEKMMAHSEAEFEAVQQTGRQYGIPSEDLKEIRTLKDLEGYMRIREMKKFAAWKEMYGATDVASPATKKVAKAKKPKVGRVITGEDPTGLKVGQQVQVWPFKIEGKDVYGVTEETLDDLTRWTADITKEFDEDLIMRGITSEYGEVIANRTKKLFVDAMKVNPDLHGRPSVAWAYAWDVVRSKVGPSKGIVKVASKIVGPKTSEEWLKLHPDGHKEYIPKEGEGIQTVGYGVKSEEAKKNAARLANTEKGDMTFYGGIPGYGQVYDYLQKNMPNVFSAIGKSRFVKQVELLTHSPMYASKNPLYQEAFQFHYKNYWTKQRVSDSWLFDYKRASQGVTKEGRIKVGEALENEELVAGLNKKELTLYNWNKNFYKSSMRLFVEMKAGDKAPLIEALAKQVKFFRREAMWAGKKLEGPGTKFWDDIQEQYKLGNDELRALQVASREIDEYLPHVFPDFERVELRQALEDRKHELLLGKAKTPRESKSYAEELKELDHFINQLANDRPVSFRYVPKEAQNKFFKQRYGLEGYTKDSQQALFPYMKGLLRELYDDPAVKLWHKNIASIDAMGDVATAEYARNLVRDYMGLNPRSGVYSTIRSLEYMRIFGFNTSSAAVNLLQSANVIADVAPWHSAKGFAQAAGTVKRNSVYHRLWNESGLANLAYDFGAADPGFKLPYVLEKSRAILGFFHKQTEVGLRKHAFFTYLSHGQANAKKLGINNIEDLHWYAVSKTNKAHFDYSQLGMPQVTKGFPGVLTQFYSFPIKQMEFLVDMAKKNPLKLLGYVAITEGTRKSVAELLDIDLSNQIGFGINYGEAVKTLRELSARDLTKAAAHFQMIPRGTGIFPSSLPPVVKTVFNFIEKAPKGEWMALKNDVSPVMWGKIQQLAVGWDRRKGDMLPLYNKIPPMSWKDPGTDPPVGELTLTQFLEKTFLFKPLELTRQQEFKKAAGIIEGIAAPLEETYRRTYVPGSAIHGSAELREEIKKSLGYTPRVTERGIISGYLKEKNPDPRDIAKVERYLRGYDQSKELFRETFPEQGE